jgi:hypothetical protein
VPAGGACFAFLFSDGRAEPIAQIPHSIDTDDFDIQLKQVFVSSSPTRGEWKYNLPDSITPLARQNQNHTQEENPETEEQS